MLVVVQCSNREERRPGVPLVSLKVYVSTSRGQSQRIQRMLSFDQMNSIFQPQHYRNSLLLVKNVNGRCQ